jgi:hypothetical protein
MIRFARAVMSHQKFVMRRGEPRTAAVAVPDAKELRAMVPEGHLLVVTSVRLRPDGCG